MNLFSHTRYDRVTVVDVAHSCIKPSLTIERLVLSPLIALSSFKV